MSSKRELEIIATFKDFVSKRLQGLQGEVIKISGTLRKMADGLKHVGKTMTEVGQNAVFLGAAITGPLALAFRNAEKYSAPVAEEMQRLKDVTTSFQVSVATAMVPVIHKLTNILARLLNAWNSLSPALRENIIQGALMGGMFLTLGGAALVLAGKIFKIGSVIVDVVAKLTLFAAANPMILVVAGAVAALVWIFQKLGITATDVLNTLEIGANMVAIGFHKVVKVIQSSLSTLLDSTSKVYDKLAQLKMLPEGMRRNYDTAAKSLKSMSNELRGAAAVQDNAIKNLQNNITKIFQTGQGSLAGGLEDIKGAFQKFQEWLKNPGEFKIEPMVERFNALKEVVSQTASAMHQSFSQGFFDLITGDLESAKDTFKNFGREVLKILTSVLTKMLLMKTIGNLNFGGSVGKLGQYFANGGIMTSGGAVGLRKYSSGGIANSPQLAMFGEGSKPEAYVPLPDGRRIPVAMQGAGAGVTIQPVIVFKFFDATDVFRHQKQIENVVVNAISRNGSIRGAMKKYA